MSVTKNGVIPQLDSAAKSNDGDNRKLVRKGDFVINSRSDRKGSSGIAMEDGSVSLIYIVIEPEEIHPTYCNYLLKGNSFVEEFYRNGHGIVADLWTTRYSEMKNIKIGIPELQEQVAIASFLDDKVGQIDEAIDQKEQLIQLLGERKQIIIQNAVTKGLNPNAPMKDSGIEWIGQIPEHWEVNQTRRFLTSIEQGDSPSISNSDTSHYVLKLSAVNQGCYKKRKMKPVSKDSYQSKYQVKKGNFLLTRGNTPDLVADTCIVDYEPNERVMFSDLIFRLNFSHKADLNFLLLAYQSQYMRRAIKCAAKGSNTTMIKVNQDSIRSFLIITPPIKEQQEIVLHVETQAQKITQAIHQAAQSIKTLKEYKATLINSAVTGKIKIS